MKSRRPLSSKKAPEPDESHKPISDWISDAKPALNPIVQKLDRMIREQLTKPRYAVKWGKAYYGAEGHGWCVELVAYDVSVNVVFLNGSKLDQPPELGDEARYLKIHDIEELGLPQLRKWIEQSCGMPGWAW